MFWSKPDGKCSNQTASLVKNLEIIELNKSKLFKELNSTHKKN